MNPYQNFWGNPNIGDGTKIGAYVEIGQGVKIGKNCKIEAFTFMPPGVELEDEVFVGPHVCFTNDRQPPSNGQGWTKTLVKKGASIGANATILSDITIGENTMVGAGAVVTKDVPSGETWIGNPARRLDKQLGTL